MTGRGPIESDIDYFTRRANEERRAALSAAHPDARIAHLQLADRYTELAQAIHMQNVRLGVDLPDEAVF